MGGDHCAGIRLHGQWFDAYLVDTPEQVLESTIVAEGIQTETESVFDTAALRHIAAASTDKIQGRYFPGYDVILLTDPEHGYEHELIHRIDHYERRYDSDDIPAVEPGNPHALFDQVDFVPQDDVDTVYCDVLAEEYDIDTEQTAAVLLSDRDDKQFTYRRFTKVTDGNLEHLQGENDTRDVREFIAYYLGPADGSDGIQGYGFTPTEITLVENTLQRMDKYVSFDQRELIRRFATYNSVPDLVHDKIRYPPLSFGDRRKLNGELRISDE